MKRPTITLLALAFVAITFFLYPQQFSSGGGVMGQKQRARNRTRLPAANKIDFSIFKHSTHALAPGQKSGKPEQQTCAACHKILKSTWQKARISQLVPDLPEVFPDVVDAPDHDACVRCHRPQFFKGAQPVICTICHKSSLPKGDARFDFRSPSPPRPRQFKVDFPHDKHEDVIALRRALPGFREAAGTFVKSAYLLDEKRKKYNDCEICHVADTKRLVAAPPKVKGDFAPFETLPRNHAFCFSCHLKGAQPTKDNCGGCHKPVATYLPVEFHRETVSKDFTHCCGTGTEGAVFTRKNHDKECTQCHINITRAIASRGPGSDLRIDPSCSGSRCHDEVFLDEMDAYKKPQTGINRCPKCHIPEVSAKDPPESHTRLQASLQ